jgi:phosphatidylethanolamine/phosphatidyl-N-methylethanolamine N-methyltransferase
VIVRNTGSKGDKILFLRQFLRNPLTVGAVAPSSRRLSRAMVAGLHHGPGACVAEFGPGTGSFTASIAATLAPSARYLGIERNAVFAERLGRKFPDLRFVCGSVENVLELVRDRLLLPLDAVISGLPFASFSRVVTNSILDGLHASLRDGGTFTTFEYVHTYGLPSTFRFRREMRRRFGAPVSRKLVAGNLPAALVLRWRKTAAGESPALCPRLI